MSILKSASVVLAAAIVLLAVDAFATAASAAATLGYMAAPGVPYGAVVSRPNQLQPPTHRPVSQPPVRVKPPTAKVRR